MDETKTIEISQKLFMLLGAFLAVVAISMIGTVVYQFRNLPESYPREISVTGEGRAYGKPDVVTIALGAYTEAEKSQDAVSKNNQIMDAVIKSVKEMGVKDEDIKTTMYNLNPLYDYAKPEIMPMYYPPYPDQKRKITSYSLDQQIEVKIRDFTKINEILDRATENGANIVGSLYFTVDDMEKIRSQARQQAIEQAKEKAASLTNQSGLQIVKLLNIYEGYYGGGMPYGCGLGCGGLNQSADASYAKAPQIQPGQTEVSTTVTLIYRVR